MSKNNVFNYFRGMHFNLQNSALLFLLENSKKTLLVAENHGNEKAL